MLPTLAVIGTIIYLSRGQGGGAGGGIGKVFKMMNTTANRVREWLEGEGGGWEKKRSRDNSWYGRTAGVASYLH